MFWLCFLTSSVHVACFNTVKSSVIHLPDPNIFELFHLVCVYMISRIHDVLSDPYLVSEHLDN